ncbi:hypothetical protein D3C87_1567880 [compost metagenome]
MMIVRSEISKRNFQSSSPIKNLVQSIEFINQGILNFGFNNFSFFPVYFQLAFQYLPRHMDPRFYCADRDLQFIGDLMIFITFKVS